MIDAPDRIARLRHPILRLEVLAPDGHRSAEHRVFCKYRRRSVPLDECRACAHRDAISDAPSPAVTCTIRVRGPAAPPDELGVRTPVGSVLLAGAIVLERGTTVRDALRVLCAEDRRSVPIVGADRVVIGIVYEAALAPGRAAERPDADVARLMSVTLTIHESLPVRRALHVLAAAHLREAAVVDDANVPLGVFRDVDGLRWLRRPDDERRATRNVCADAQPPASRSAAERQPDAAQARTAPVARPVQKR
ncbi:MAG: CBS domain-containing protein [Labilithrix sp.]|nr:CBS domain-containing protein [Labilithrix sp.]